MGTCSLLATTLDLEMLVARVAISPLNTPDNVLTIRPGQAVANDLGGRFLVRYLRPNQLNWFNNGTDWNQWVTPTAYAPEEAGPWLALPVNQGNPTHALLLDPRPLPA